MLLAELQFSDANRRIVTQGEAELILHMRAQDRLCVTQLLQRIAELVRDLGF